jgi:hypothetical protein
VGKNGDKRREIFPTPHVGDENKDSKLHFFILTMFIYAAHLHKLRQTLIFEVPLTNKNRSDFLVHKVGHYTPVCLIVARYVEDFQRR